MIRLHLVVEGQTEETFVRDLLTDDLARYDVIADAHRITTGRRRGHPYRGGHVSYEHLRRDLRLWLTQDQNRHARFTSMIDLYRIPRGFPGFDESRRLADPISRAEFLEAELARDLNDRRFLPFIQVHEFEALLFSDPSAFAVAFPGRESAISELSRIRNGFPSPEHIDDGEHTSPSKRICALFPDYEKAALGAVIAGRIGLDAMARECAHFRSWLDDLRALR